MEQIAVSPSEIAPGGFALVTIEAVDTEGGYMSFRLGTEESRNYSGNNTFIYQAPQTTGTHGIDVYVGNGHVDALGELTITVDNALAPSTLRSGRTTLPLGKSFDFFTGNIVDQYYGDIDFTKYLGRPTLNFSGNREGASLSTFDGGLINLSSSIGGYNDLDQIIVAYSGDYYQRGTEALGDREYRLEVDSVYCFLLRYSDDFFGKFKIISIDDENIVFDWVFQAVPGERKFYDYSSNLGATASPEAPQGLSATANYTTVGLTWDAGTETDLIGYWVYRSTTSGSGFSRIKSVGLRTSTTDTGLSSTTTYYYMIKAIDSSFNEGDFSSEISVVTGQASSEPDVIINDNAEDGLTNWTTNGFILSDARSASASHSFYSGSGNYLNNTLTLNDLIAITGSESLQFYTYYQIETGYDYLYVQVSEDGRNWTTLKSFTGLGTSWTQTNLALAAYADKNIYIRFKYYTDSSVSYNGAYIDDIIVQ
ncbi:MAG: choice-of-anchor J domain-containing protein [bacterium]